MCIRDRDSSAALADHVPNPLQSSFELYSQAPRHVQLPSPTSITSQKQMHAVYWYILVGAKRYTPQNDDSAMYKLEGVFRKYLYAVHILV